MQAVKALTRLRVCADSSEPSLLAYTIITEIPCCVASGLGYCILQKTCTLVLTLHLLRERERESWLLYFNCLLASVLCALLVAVPWADLQCVIVAFVVIQDNVFDF